MSDSGANATQLAQLYATQEGQKTEGWPTSQGGRPTTSPGRPTRGQKGQGGMLVGHTRKVASQMSRIQLYGGRPEIMAQGRGKPDF